jgi:calreticulin
LYLYKDFGAIGFDLWQVKSGTIFDNVLITDSVEEAKAHAAETFEPLKEAEKKKKEKHDEEEKKRLEEEEKKRKEEEDAKKAEGGDKDEDEVEEEKGEDHDEL